MTTYRPGRLHQVLDPLVAADPGVGDGTWPGNVLTVTAADSTPHPDTTWTDPQIISATLTRGSREQYAGLTPSTATVTVTGAAPLALDQDLRVTLSVDVGVTLAHLTGITTNEIMQRWTGRTAQQTVTDHGPSRRTTQIQASHWAAQALLTSATVRPSDAGSAALTDVYTTFWENAGLPGLFAGNYITDNYAVSGEHFVDTINGTDLFGKYSTDLGVWWTTTRDGDVIAQDTTRLYSAAVLWAATNPYPIDRRQATAPATWVQPATSPAIISYTRHPPGDHNSTGTYSIEVYDGLTGTDRPLRVDTIDVTHCWDDNTPENGQSPLVTSMNARMNRAAGLWYSLPSVTLDLLTLLQSDDPRDAHMVGQLLTLEHLQPVALTNDWPPEVAGVYFVTQITENITPDEWTLTLGLQRLEFITGQHTSDTFVPGTTWDRAYLPGISWDTATNTWDQTPTT